MRRRLACVVLLPLVLAAGPAQAQDRALLVGVGQFADPQVTPLPGIDLDLQMARQTTITLGFSPSQIKILANEEATLERIRATFDEWLVAGPGPNDRVLFYFSGHGTLLPSSSPDRVDEAILPYDTRSDAAAPQNLLVNHMFAAWLDKLNAGTAYVLIDACHSGSMTKSARLPSDAVVKYFPLPSASRSAPLVRGPDRGFLDVSATRALAGRYVALTAAADNELSIATRRGSSFTIGVSASVANAAAARTVSMRQVQAQSLEEISRIVPVDRVHHPQLQGDPRLADANLFLPSRPAASHPALWTDVEQLVDRAGERLALSGLRPEYTATDRMQIAITLPRAGYLNVVTISEVTGTAMVLFPNRFAPEANRFDTAGVVRLPGPNARYVFGFALPAGVREERNLLVTFLTDRPLNAYQLGSGAALFRDLTQAGLRSLKGAIVAEATYAAAKFEYVLH